MGTRCQIIVAGHTASIYRHWDGNPEAVLPDLLPIVKAFMTFRRDDPSYLTAQVCHHLIARSHRDRKRSAKRDGRVLGDLLYLGYGIDGHAGKFHGDEEFIYVIQPDHVEVRWTVKPFWDEATLENTRLVKRVDFNGKPYKAHSARLVSKGGAAP